MRFKPTNILLLGILSVVTGSSGLAQDARLIAKNTLPSVVLLEMYDADNNLFKLGSGFFVRSDVVATNYHVIEGASSGAVKMVGQPSRYLIAGTIGIDKLNDLALIKLIGANEKPLVLGDLSGIEVGQEIFALGSPRGLEGTISPGIVSGMHLRELGNENLIQITAPISSGSSGGPVVNGRGEVIGVAVASLKDGQNLNFAVPSSYLLALLAGAKNVSVLTGGAPSRTEPINTSPPKEQQPPLPQGFLTEPVHNWKEYGKTDENIMYYDQKSTGFTEEGTLLVWERIKPRSNKSDESVSLQEIDCSGSRSRLRRYFGYVNGVRTEADKSTIERRGSWKFFPPNTAGGTLIKKVCDLYYN